MTRSFLFFLLIVFLFAKLNAQSIGGICSGTAEYCTTINSGFVSITGYNGSVLYWEASTNNGGSWNSINNFTPTQSYTNLSQTTWYRAVVQDGAFPSATSNVAIITIHPPAIAGTLQGGGTFCSTSGPGSLTISGNQGTVLHWENSTDNGQTWTFINTTSLSIPYTSISQNTLYKAIISNVSTCPTDTTNIVSFIIHQQTNGGIINSSDTICNGSNGDTLHLLNNNGAVLNWQLSTNEGLTWNTTNHTDSVFIYSNLTATTWYRASVQSGICNAVNSSIAKLTVVNPEAANAGSDQIIIQYKNCAITSSGNGSVNWEPTNGLNNSTMHSPQASPHTTTTYTLILTDIHGCLSTDSVTITVIVPIPSAITPNDDGVNDFLIVDKIEDYPVNMLSITNRWGIEVFNSSPYKNNWNGINKNGKDLPDDIYYYVFDYGNETKGIVSGFILIKR